MPAGIKALNSAQYIYSILTHPMGPMGETISEKCFYELEKERGKQCWASVIES